MTVSLKQALSPGRICGVQRLARAGLVATLGVLLVVAGCSNNPKVEGASATAERLYRDAKEDMEAGSYERAIKGFERVEGLAAGTLLAQQAQLDMAYLQWRSDERATALTTIERFIKLNPSSPALDYALYLRGVINFNDNVGLFGNLTGQSPAERDQRASRDAYQAFKQLVDQFPNSSYTPDARMRMDYIVNSLADHELHVARYYLRRGAYVAAANRARQAVTDYQQTPATEEALALLVQSYDKLQLTSLRDDAARVLKQNFPDSRFLAGLPAPAPAAVTPAPVAAPAPAPAPAAAAPAAAPAAAEAPAAAASAR
jgi:outer membrane protein assembly factor BamD